MGLTRRYVPRTLVASRFRAFCIKVRPFRLVAGPPVGPGKIFLSLASYSESWQRNRLPLELVLGSPWLVRLGL